MTQTPVPTTVIAPHSSGIGSACTYLTRWEIDENRGAELVVRRSGEGAYQASFRAVTFERTATGRVSVSTSMPAAAVAWTIETTPRYSAKRLREVNAATTAGLADLLAAGSPDHASHLAQATAAGALGVMHRAAFHLHVTYPEADPNRCGVDATPGWRCLAITYPSGNPRTHAYYREDDERWEVSCFPDADLATPYCERNDVTSDDLSAVVVDHYRRTTA